MRRVSSFLLHLLLFSLPSHAADVYVLDIKGKVRYKHPHKTFWYTLIPTSRLYFGDILYIYPDSSVTIRYPTQDATVTISHNGLFVISQKVPQLKYYERVFSRKVAGGKEKDPNGNTHVSPFLRHVTPTEKSKDETKKKVDKIKNPSLSVRRDIKPMKWADPRATVKVVTQKLPAFGNFSVEPKMDSGLLWAYLWYRKRESPVWIGLSFEKFNKVKFPYFGEYMLQVISEEENYATSPMKVVVEKGIKPSISHNWKDGEVLIIP